MSKKMISIASGFQYSVNIGFDLSNDDKLKNFIPTKSAMQLMKDILLSTRENANERARILIGAYGKGKSHIVLAILSLLMGRDRSLFQKLLPRLDEEPGLRELVNEYAESKMKILPVVITGSSTSLTQAFLLALQRTLSQNGMQDVMPDTNYKAAIKTIDRWKLEYPETYEKLKGQLNIPIESFISKLDDYDSSAYAEFERIYPILTSGSLFNPFIGFDVVELYESATKVLKEKGFSGIYVIYDEFSKYLEANITDASVSDTKMLQDFAEKCNRSGDTQMHLMLISHKEISNYIDKLPKQKVDGWRGVSERFLHIHLNNNFSQTYGIIASVIHKDLQQWEVFKNENSPKFDNLSVKYARHKLFQDLDEEAMDKVITGCYPLHPVSTYILPRLSEKVAQNERTLFTFLSANTPATLSAFLAQYGDQQFELITPDWIYDYFEPLLQKELNAGSIHDTFILSARILRQLQPDSLQAKIIKAIALIYMLEQFERLQPTQEEILDIFGSNYSVEEIKDAIDDLIENKYLIYLKRSNGYLQLKQSSGVDIWQQIKDTIEGKANSIAVKDVLNNVNFDNYLYPSRYNDEHAMTRYFPFVFIDAQEVKEDTDWEKKSESISGDGIVYAVVPESEEMLQQAKDILEKTTGYQRIMFVLPVSYREVRDIVKEFYAVSLLKDETVGDEILFDEYEVIYEDLYEVISDYIRSFTRPETGKALFIHEGKHLKLYRKANLSEKLSDICNQIYSKTPVINNEVINKDDITSMATNSRSKIIAALLRNELEPNLGLVGTGQEVSIMRSTLVMPKILVENNGYLSIDLEPNDEDCRIAYVLNEIKRFVDQSAGGTPLSVLYDRLIKPEYHIGLRKGLIPIYIAAVLHEYKQRVVLKENGEQLALNADALIQINADPTGYSIALVDWSPDKEAFVDSLGGIFQEYVIDAEKATNVYDYVIYAMRRWYLSLPKYSREAQVQPDGKKMKKSYLDLMRMLKGNEIGYELLFKKLPKAFNHDETNLEGLEENLTAAKKRYDELLEDLETQLRIITRETYAVQQESEKKRGKSLRQIMVDWCDTLQPSTFAELFTDGTNKALELYKNVTADESTFIRRLAKLTTGLRLEDWDDNTIIHFKEAIAAYKTTAEKYQEKAEQTVSGHSEQVEGYRITYKNEQGETVTKHFDRVDASMRAGLLKKRVEQAINEFGQAVSDEEKRQVLMDVLQTMF